jgi:hypothetical protein
MKTPTEPIRERPGRDLEGQCEGPEDPFHNPDLRERNVAELGQI